MEYRFNTPLNGNIAMTYHYHEDAALRRDKSLYKFVWVQSGTLDIEVDHVVMHLEKDEPQIRNRPHKMTQRSKR